MHDFVFRISKNLLGDDSPGPPFTAVTQNFLSCHFAVGSAAHDLTATITRKCAGMSAVEAC